MYWMAVAQSYKIDLVDSAASLGGFQLWHEQQFLPFEKRTNKSEAPWPAAPELPLHCRHAGVTDH